MRRIDAEELYRMLDGVVIDDAKVFSYTPVDHSPTDQARTPVVAVVGRWAMARMSSAVWFR
jgi:predicted metal-binding membrane protein